MGDNRTSMGATMTHRPYLTLERAAEVAERIRMILRFDPGEVSEEVESLLAMALDAPYVLARHERATWSAFLAGADYGDKFRRTLQEIGDHSDAVDRCGCQMDAHHNWRIRFNAKGPER